MSKPRSAKPPRASAPKRAPRKKAVPRENAAPAGGEGPKRGGRRGAQDLPRIVVTGLAGRLGRLLAKQLHRLGSYEVVGIDRRPIDDLPKDIQHLRVDLRSRATRDVFRAGNVAALIHLGIMHDPRRGTAEHHSWNVLGTSRLLSCCQDYGVRKVVVLSSADVYGPQAENQQFLTEDAPLMGAMDFPGIRDLIEVDMQATSFFWRCQGGATETVVLRPVHILGSVHNAASNYLRLARVPVLMGFDPMVQVIHEQDVVDAILLSLRPGMHGLFNVTGPGEVPLSVILKELGKPTLPIPSPLFGAAMRALWRLRLTSFPVPELAHIRFTAMVDGGRARNVLGFRPRHSLRETVRAVGAPMAEPAV
ncbi:MAG: NAD-dependent epimerase/dehydratase family protein [Deltaproteobacteria bacterium]|nr:NAD-dependent epimerase/dehydratase family protein [Deltaproteobacteria bacterium]